MSKSEEWKQISGGQHHALALDGNGLLVVIQYKNKNKVVNVFCVLLGKVYAFGRSEYGRLGLGDKVKDEVKEPRLVSELSEKKCVRINCGTCVSFAVTDEGNFCRYCAHFAHDFVTQS